MKPKFIEHIKIAILDRLPTREKYAGVSFETTTGDTLTAYTCHNRYRASCTLEFTNIAPAGAENEVRRKAVAQFKHHLYGEIRNELYEILSDLRNSDDAAAMSKVEALLTDLV